MDSKIWYIPAKNDQLEKNVGIYCRERQRMNIDLCRKRRKSEAMLLWMKTVLIVEVKSTVRKGNNKFEVFGGNL